MKLSKPGGDLPEHHEEEGEDAEPFLPSLGWKEQFRHFHSKFANLVNITEKPITTLITVITW